jgi:hypothetical protein
LFVVWKGRVGMGKKKEKKGTRESVKWWYIHFYRWNHQWTPSIGDSIGNSDGELVTSLYEDSGLNPSVILSVKSLVKNSTLANRLFFYSEYFVCNYIGIYRPQYFIGIYRLNYGRNSVHR